jgi:hypothetical protein
MNLLDLRAGEFKCISPRLASPSLVYEALKIPR